MPAHLKKSFAAEQMKQKRGMTSTAKILLVVIGILVIIAGYASYRRFGVTHAPVPGRGEITSIAVLPFRDMSPDKDQDYFCEGIAETIITTLSQIEGIQVTASTSSFSFKGKDVKVGEIGRELNVETVLEGSIQKEGSRLRISAQLIKVDDGYHLWSKQYEREIESIFAIQDEIATAIVEGLKGRKLLGTEETVITKLYTENMEAYNLYLLGRYHWNRRTEEGFKKALEYFQEAIEKDSQYALAYTGIADVYTYLGIYGFEPTDEAYSLAMKYLRKALEIDDTLAEAHGSLGTIIWFNFDYIGAEEEFKRSVELNPNYPDVHHWYGYLLSCQGRHEEAIQEAEKAKELDPLSPVMNRGLGTVYFMARKYDRAITEYQNALELNPNSTSLYRLLFAVYYVLGREDESITVLEKQLHIMGYEDLSMLIETTYTESGYSTAIQTLITELDNRSIQLDFSYDLYIIIGDKDKAIELLEKAYESKSSYIYWIIYWIKFYPIFDILRSEPGFQALVKKTGLE